MPRRLNPNSREQIGREALELVREKGWASLSARSLASRLGSSVGPIYSAFGSMEALEAYVLDGAAKVFDRCIAEAGTGKSFLDMGIGFALFARDEPRLFEALVEGGAPRGSLGQGGVAQSRFEAFKAELKSRLEGDAFFSRIDPERRERIFERMWLFALGFALSFVHGYAKDRTEAGIAELMRSQGGIVIYGEVAGFGDADGAALREAWATLSGIKGGSS
jgi:AcrR family transcriptional regulator